jgi:outer membrane protein assembly factor BamB
MRSGKRKTSIGRMIHRLLILVSLATVSATAQAADWPQFRGPNRDGKSPETGLLKEWPAEGPRLLWTVEDLGHGFTSAAVADGRVYTTGLEGEEGFLYAYDTSGRAQWKKSTGKGWTEGHPGTRSTPTVREGHLYLMTGHGRVVCLDAATGEERWSVDLMDKFGARNIRWGITESLLLNGDRLICTPGGEEAGMVALHRKTGETLWICRALDDISGYCSPVLIRRGERPVILSLTKNALVSVDGQSGELLSRHAREARYGIHAVSPAYEDNFVYVTSGYGGERGEMVVLSDDARKMTTQWTDSKLDCHHGGVIAHEGHVYGASDKNSGGNWLCLDLKTGEVKAEIEAVGKGSIAYADGMLYGYGENGTVGLINASPVDFRMVSSFSVAKGNKQHWAHPVIAGGRLYIRHGNALMVYDVREEK